MAVTWYTQSGTPADTVGADGDMSFDYTNRIQWGPKSLKGAGTWAGTQVNAVGPTGPGVLGGTGQPASSVGQSGNVYIDGTNGDLYLKGASSWSKTGAIASGVPTPNLGQFASTYGASYWANGLASTTTAQALPLQGTTFTTTFTATANMALMGYQCTSVSNSTATFVIQLQDLTTNTTLFSFTIGKGTVMSGSFTATQVPLNNGDVYQWQISGAGTAYVALTPQYLTPSGNGVAASFYATSSTYSGQALSSTASALFVPGTSSSIAQTQYYRNSKLSYLYDATFIIGAGTGNVTFALTTGTAVYTSPSYTATSNQQIIKVGPFGPSTAVLQAATNYYWSVTGSGTIACAVNMSVVQ